MFRIAAIRTIEALIALLLMSLVIFFLSRVTGDPVALLLGDGATEADKASLVLGLNQFPTLQVQVDANKLARAAAGSEGGGRAVLVQKTSPWAC